MTPSRELPVAEIRLSGIRHQYVKGEYALKEIDITWDDGGAYALLGPSGCGKTTMLDIISGLLSPSEGHIYFDGVDVTEQPAVKRNIAQVFQFPVLYESMTVEQNMRFPLRNRGIGKLAAQARAEEIAEILGITDLLSKRAKGLSADAKQLVSLARALVRQDVAAVLFDEPLTVIDPQKKWKLRQALKRVQAELRHTLVYVTHDQTEALTFADRVVVMNEGEILQRATPDELFERPAHRFVGNFIGSPGMNFLRCQVRDGSVSLHGVDLLRLPTDTGEDGDHDDVVGIRPDYVHWLTQDGPQAVAATVTEVRDLGAAHLVYLQLNRDGNHPPLIAKLPADHHAPSSESRGWVRLEPDKVHFFRDGELVPGCEAVTGEA